MKNWALTKPGTWDWFQANGGITDEQAASGSGRSAAPDQEKAEADQPTTLRLNLLAAEAYRQSLLSEGQLARLLGLDVSSCAEYWTIRRLKELRLMGSCPTCLTDPSALLVADASTVINLNATGCARASLKGLA